MSFKDELNNYIELIDISAKELASKANISSSTLCRYRNGDRVPKRNSVHLKSLISAIKNIADNKNIKINKKDIKNNLEKYLPEENINNETFKYNLNVLIKELQINTTDLAKYIGYDSSYISKIRNGSRKPQNQIEFITKISKYIIKNYNEDEIKNIINSKELSIDIINNWLLNNNYTNNIDSFLLKLDEFDLNEFIKTTNFDKIKIPTLPIQLSKSKTYYGLKGYKDSQLDILKTIILSKSKSDVYFYSNMSIDKASKDKEFKNKFIMGIGLLLKKGLKLNIIHNVDRPFNELIQGLEGWIPLYMTGQINPYYLKDNSNKLYSQIECVTNFAALSGNGITSNLEHSKYYVTNKKKEINYYIDNMNLLMKKASPLMDIYATNNKYEFENLLNNNINIKGKRKNIMYNLPIYILDEKLLKKLLDKNNISINDQKSIINYINNEKKQFNEILKNNEINDYISIIDKDTFDTINYYLPLSKIYNSIKIKYSYDDYLEHIKLIKKFKNKNYNYYLRNNYIFKNINIYIIQNKQVIISKEKNPNIHFVIYHKKLIDAINNYKIKESE